MTVINNYFKKNRTIEIQEKMSKAMHSSNKHCNYAFRKGQWWYLFANWNPPYTGTFERWMVDNQNNWEPQVLNSQLDINQIKIIFNLENWNLNNPQKQFFNLVFSKDGKYLGVIWKCQGESYLDVISLKQNVNVLVALKVTTDSNILISNSGVYYCKENNSNWPNSIFFHAYDELNPELIYKENDNRCKLSFQEVSSGSVFLISRSLTRTKCWIISNRTKHIVFDSSIKDGKQFLSAFTVTNKKKEYFGTCHKIGEKLYRIDLYLGSKKKFSNILIGSEIHSVVGVSDCLVFEFFDCGIREFAYIKLDDLLIDKSIKEFPNIMNKLGKNIKLYQNNFAPLKFYFFQSDQVNHEILREVDTNKKEIITISQNEITDFQLSDKALHICHKQIVALSRDKTTHIPISLFWQGTTSNELPTKQKTIVYVYGAYGKDELDYSLSPMILGFIDAGFVFAVAQVRGGGYYGGDWYRSGKLLNKWNSINDFLDCCKSLLTNNISLKNDLAAFTTSAGGVIIGAAINECPDLLSAAILFSPFVNPYDTMLDLDQPVARREVMEWGNAKESSIIRNYILSYSPLQNIPQNSSLKRTYIMAICGSKDYLVSNTDTKHWINRLNIAGFNAHFKLNKHSGHGGGSEKDSDIILQQVTNFLSEI